MTLAPGRAPAEKSTHLLSRSLLFLAAMSALAAAAYAAAWDADHARSPFRTSTLILLVVSGALMLSFAIRLGSNREKEFAAKKIGWRNGSRALFIGLGWSYFVALAAGPQPGAAYVFLAALASWICVFSWFWIAAPRAGSFAAELGNRWWIRPIAVGVFWMLVSLSIVEGGLRLFAFCQRRANFRAEPSLATIDPPMDDHLQEDHFHDSSATLPTSLATSFRIAVLGGPTEIGVHELSSQLGPRLPGVEVRNFTSAAGPLNGYRDGLSTAIDAYRPQLLLVFLAVDGDLTRSEPTVSLFDWRGLQVVQACRAALGKQAPPAASVAIEPGGGSNSYRHFLESCSLAVCRKPLEETVLDGWNANLVRLDDLAYHCEQSATTMGIVLAPAEFQLDPATFEALCRCAGCSTEQVDLDLPQRRMDAYAAGRHLPCVDLLPYLRASKSLPYCRHSRQWNETGNTIVANAVAQFVMGRYGNQIAASNPNR